MENHRVIELVGIAIFVVGAVLLAIGTTSTGLFIFYGVVAVVGVAIAAYGRRLRDQR